MKALVCVEPRKLEYKNVEAPVFNNNTAIIKIKQIGVCGTDLHAYEGTQPYFNYPRILGHELSGELIESSGAEGFQQGETVTFLPYVSCGHCVACKNGKENCCVQMKVFGVHIDGGMAEYLQVPAAALFHSEGLSYKELALVEPLAIAAHGIRRAAIKKDEFILIVGAGPIGIAAI